MFASRWWIWVKNIKKVFLQRKKDIFFLFSKVLLWLEHILLEEYFNFKNISESSIGIQELKILLGLLEIYCNDVIELKVFDQSNFKIEEYGLISINLWAWLILPKPVKFYLNGPVALLKAKKSFKNYCKLFWGRILSELWIIFKDLNANFNVFGWCVEMQNASCMNQNYVRENYWQKFDILTWVLCKESEKIPFWFLNALPQM